MILISYVNLNEVIYLKLQLGFVITKFPKILQNMLQINKKYFDLQIIGD